MLTLNTGQSPMSVRHQIEILYSNYLDKNISSEIRLLKEVEETTPHRIGEYRFNDVIDGFTSYILRDESSLDRRDLLESIKSLEKLALENQDKDLFLKLLKNKEKYTTFNPQLTTIRNNYELTDFYGEDIIILVLCNSSLQKIDNFQIDNYITSLYSYGYYFCEPTENLKEIDTISDSENPSGKKLIIQKNSPCLQKEDYLYRLFKDLLKNEEHHLVRFYLLYQVIELMIQIVFERRIVEEISKFNISEDKDVRKLKNKIEDISKEDRRVSILINNDVKINNPNLLISCNELIKLFNDDDSNEKDDISKKQDLGGVLYDVRCLIVHQFRKLPEKTLEEKLREINKEFENIVIKIILDYK
jgi:hypothetical protein